MFVFQKMDAEEIQHVEAINSSGVEECGCASSTHNDQVVERCLAVFSMDSNVCKSYSFVAFVV